MFGRFFSRVWNVGKEIDKKALDDEYENASSKEKSSPGQDDVVKEIQKKYDDLQTEMASMKKQYESRISQLEKQGTAPDKQQMVTKVKQIMSSVYHELKDEFDSNSLYKGADINTNIMNTIKRVTMEMIQDEGESSAKVKESKQPAGDIFPDSKEETAPVSLSQKVTALKHLVSLHEDEEAINADMQTIKPTIIAEEGGERGGGGMDMIIKATVASPTGGKGNPYREQQLRLESEDEPMIKVSRTEAGATGGRGNPLREQEILARGSET